MPAFTLKSPAFENRASIPRQHTCDGKNVSPALSWTGAPEKTRSFALVMDDPDAPGKTWVHWVVFDLPAGATGLPEGVPPRPSIESGGLQGANDFGKVGYGGPCPPSGTHNYVFTLYALDGELALPGRPSKAALLRAMEGHVLGQARLIGQYSRK
jgi:Raf kinase inhibitor-like YbhB/YbcL family protein